MDNQFFGARKMIAPLAGALSLPHLVALSGRHLLVPLYHIVSNEHLPHISPLYAARTEALFRADLEFLLEFFEPVDLDELEAGDLPRFHLTFDDGLREVYDVAFPILKEHKLTATLFLNPAFIDNKQLFYRHKAALLLDALNRNEKAPGSLAEIITKYKLTGAPEEVIRNASYAQQGMLDEIADVLGVDFEKYLQEQKPYMTTAQVQEMIAAGFTIGAHSVDHPLYSELSLEEQMTQTRESITQLQATFGVTVDTFAFPFTDYGVKAEFFERMYAELELRHSFGTAGLKLEQWPQHIHRVPMEVGDEPARSILQTEYLYHLIKVPFGKNMMDRD